MAQLAERSAVNRKVRGSNPRRGAFSFFYFFTISFRFISTNLPTLNITANMYLKISMFQHLSRVWHNSLKDSCVKQTKTQNLRNEEVYTLKS